MNNYYIYSFKFSFTRHGMPQQDVQTMESWRPYTPDELKPEIELRVKGYVDTEGNGEIVSITEYEVRKTKEHLFTGEYQWVTRSDCR